jgi:4,5-dihydroxyphthalate decarboxylase
MLLDGELDAVLGEKVEKSGLKPLFPDAAAEEELWFAKYGVLPINHMVVVSRELADHHPDEVREVFRLLRESAARAPAASVPQFGNDEMPRSLQMIIGYAA